MRHVVDYRYVTPTTVRCELRAVRYMTIPVIYPCYNEPSAARETYKGGNQLAGGSAHFDIAVIAKSRTAHDAGTGG
ncbi:hypothetical protein J15TS10_23780 [Paenibacillus woosongensis]|uniref:Uncharacterized protein n=1 Tax=Paenibacillus woosongensis TaxID=307580 RepID=A0ABQ4MRE1_9BACL|nr:hypothetical protein J15TS10_23780 [Paenibacillus woosongensis]